MIILRVIAFFLVPIPIFALLPFIGGSALTALLQPSTIFEYMAYGLGVLIVQMLWLRTLRITILNMIEDYKKNA